MTGEEMLCKLKADVNGSFLLADIPQKVDITRKQAAIIIHGYIKKIMEEPDETETFAATVLKDLYDCRVCVKHIEQVYVKGIMEPLIGKEASGRMGLPVIFGGNELLSDDEANVIVERIFDKTKRKVV